MHRDIFEITNKGLGFKLINFMSFGELLFSVGFIEETIKNLFFKRNDGIQVLLELFFDISLVNNF